MQNFHDKVIWITGASSGIGREMARQCSEKGASVILSSRKREALEEVRQSLAHSEKAMVLPLDMEKPEEFPGKVQEVLDRFGKIDLLFNNAGMSQRSEAHETPLPVDRKLMEVNYFGNIFLTKAVLPVMRKQRHGHLTAMSSLSGKFGFFERSAYAASKHALHGFFESLRMEENDNNIKVTIFCPGPVQTDISRHALDASGNPTGKMDSMQLNGMPVQKCVAKMMAAIEAGKKEVVIASAKEKFGVRLHALLPGLFYKMILKQRP